MIRKISCACIIGLLALTASAETKISIEPNSAQPVNRRILGNNQLAYQNFKNVKTDGKHLVFDCGHGVWNPANNAPVPAMVAFSKKAGISVQRFPGGCGTHRFDWKKAIGTPEERPNQKFGLPEFLNFCEATGAEPLITLSAFVGNAADKAELVEYLNAPNDGKHPWAARRAKDGRPEPWNVVWFEFGNETYHGDHNGNNFTPEEYAARYLECRKAMRNVDPKVKLSPILWSGHGRWDPVVLKIAGKEADFFTVHIYIGSYTVDNSEVPPEEVFKTCLGGARGISIAVETYLREQKEAGITELKPLAVTEHNSGFLVQKPVPYRFSLGGALLVSEELRQLLYNPHILMATYWQFANEFWGMIRNYEAPYVERPSYRMQVLFNRYLLDELLTPKVNSPLFDAPGGFGMPRAEGKPSKARKLDGNLLKQKNWGLHPLGAMTGKVKHTEHANGTLEVEFLNGADLNYYHADKKMPADPRYSYILTAEVRTEGLEKTSGVAVDIGDSCGYNATQSLTETHGLLSDKWQTVSAVYTPMPDTKSLTIRARRLLGRNPGKMFIRNVKVMRYIPESIGASPLVEATVSRSKDGKKLAFVLINKSLDAAESVTLAVPGTVKATAEALTGPSVAATNEDNPECVAIHPASVEVRKDGVRLQLPPHSLTGVLLEL